MLPKDVVVIKFLKDFFRADDALSKIAVALFVINITLLNLYGFIWDCSHKTCGGASGVKFWIFANIAPLLFHFPFWGHDKTDELSRFLAFRVFMVILSFFAQGILLILTLSLITGK